MSSSPTFSRNSAKIKSIISNECKVGEGMQITPSGLWTLTGSGEMSLMSG